MQKLVPATIRLVISLIVLTPLRLSSQISVVSNTGYAVNILVLPTNVLPSSTNCPYGYNYNLRVTYAVTMVGAIPPGLYTLQGTIRCGSTNHFFDLPNGIGIGNTNTTSNPWNSANTCNTATLLSLNCNTARIEIEGPGISHRFVNFPLSYSALPVQLTNFTATTSANKIKLSWQTASEINSDFFAVERSADGNQWEELVKINGAGDSDSARSYQWYDENPLQGFSYYRLKMNDKDSRSSFSEVRVVQAGFAKRQISIYPVPNAGRSITLSGITDYAQQRLTISNSNGVNIFSTSLTSATKELPVLKPGIYIISIQNKLSGETQNLRYVQL